MAAPTKCSREGCAHNGDWYLKICVPALGDRDRRGALRLVIDLPMCRDHFAEIEVPDFLLPESRNRIRIALMERGRAMPDFGRAWKERGLVGDADWRSFKAIQSGGAS